MWVLKWQIRPGQKWGLLELGNPHLIVTQIGLDQRWCAACCPIRHGIEIGVLTGTTLAQMCSTPITASAASQYDVWDILVH